MSHECDKEGGARLLGIQESVAGSEVMGGWKKWLVMWNEPKRNISKGNAPRQESFK